MSPQLLLDLVRTIEDDRLRASAAASVRRGARRAR